MRKPKKAKSFNYNLKTVLRVREIFEKQEKEKFAKAQREYEEEVKKEKEMQEQKKIQEDELAKRLVGEVKDFSAVMNRHRYLKKVKVDVDKQGEVREEYELKKDEQRERVIQAVKDREILDKDKNNKFKSWRKLMNREDIKTLSDIANTAFARRQLATKAHEEYLKRKKEEEADAY